MKTKRFDCVDLMHRGARRIYEATKDLSRVEELEYWRQKAAELLPNHIKRRKDAGATRKDQKTRRTTRRLPGNEAVESRPGVEALHQSR